MLLTGIVSSARQGCAQLLWKQNVSHGIHPSSQVRTRGDVWEADISNQERADKQHIDVQENKLSILQPYPKQNS